MLERQRIVSLEEDLKHARDLLVELSRSKDSKIAQMGALLEALGVDVDEELSSLPPWLR